ncbi:hypermethylated in cancer 2 protein-like [Astyanax mexicanus]|uniref:Hypermethylated in cancer 2 protein-like n=1 Tax=Astyanax mexicanus TaxID=7994 RepID=A0A8B9JGZ5_ASTMX|nr:hypermethylated in cancer 2 protein-like [Astyanax mexicanus]
MNKVYLGGGGGWRDGSRWARVIVFRMKAHVAWRIYSLCSRYRREEITLSMQELTDESPAGFNHGFMLLKELNSQRGMGQFCDCVIQLQVQPGRLFLAHKSVLAALSPVLASLLPRHGVLVDLNLPYLSPETLDILLDYIYTGTLPLQSQEEPVLSAATHLQMEQLQQALRWRRKALAESTDSVQDKPNRKRRFMEEQSQDMTPLSSPSHYPYGSEQPVSSSPSCEVVPVICHGRMAGNRDPSFSAAQSGNVSDTSKHSREPSQYGYPQPSLLDQLFEPAQTKQYRFLDVLSQSSQKDFPEAVGSRSRSSSESGEPQTVAAHKDSFAHQIACSISDKDLSSKTECGQNRIQGCPQFTRCDSSGDRKCLSDADSTQSSNAFELGKGEHLAEPLSDTFSGRNSYNRSRSPRSQALLPLEDCGTTDTSEANCERRTSDPEAWYEIGQPFAQKTLHEGKTMEISTTRQAAIEAEPQRTDLIESYEFSQETRTYQGHLRYQCLLEHQHSRVDSSDSDSDRGCLVSNTEAKESSRVLGTTDISEISFSTRRLSTSSEEHSASHPFQCSMCDRAFSQRGSLNRHMRSHLGVRPYSCPKCSMSFSRQYRVTEHMRVHQRSCDGQSEVRPRTSSTGMDV